MEKSKIFILIGFTVFIQACSSVYITSDNSKNLGPFESVKLALFAVFSIVFIRCQSRKNTVKFGVGAELYRKEFLG